MNVIVLQYASSRADLIRNSARTLANKFKAAQTTVEVVCSYIDNENVYMSKISLFNNGTLLNCSMGVDSDELTAFEIAVNSIRAISPLGKSWTI
ncbi:hypothetical protein KO525_07175 [Psychrosphaera sp. B3R10]|uniref:hypothetical protein n=1 Tax=unclassified Psychrosphaera TaxID=2641570 RepID=UPI001C0A5130|nr:MULTISPECIES: hypothetical protein [unclassified Psychrosphaera]MBU2883225.1 hypothetical protein [Psychrosphaera sp. I2R16]MBU2989156.1 hypothetical protein [Psychrosphaera sp. B3R10]MDO6720474.1 hypothetical protein [Psychrosphaera sp. 1_MG-2023]